MIQFPGPPHVPPVLPFERQAEEQLANGLRKRGGGPAYNPLIRWRWIAGGLFAAAGVFLKLLFAPRLEPSALFAGLAAFWSAAAFWTWLMPRRENASLVRGALAGGAAGLLGPPLMWVLYGVYLLASAAEPVAAFGWTWAYAYGMLAQASPFTLPLGAIAGASLVYAQRLSALPRFRTG